MTVFSAEHGMQIVYVDETKQPLPVVGWAIINGFTAYPITPMRFGGLTHGCAIMDSNGRIHDRIHDQSFDNFFEWREFVSTAEPPKNSEEPFGYVKGDLTDEDKASIAVPQKSGALSPGRSTSPDEDPALVAQAKENLRAVTGQEPAPNPRTLGTHNPPTAPAAIQFGKKAYETKSFWKWEAEQALFEIPGGVNYPKDARVEKIKRLDWTALQKDGWKVIDPTTGEIDGENSGDDDDGVGEAMALV